MNPRRALVRARLPLCIVAAFGAHGLAAAALPAHAHRAAPAALADAPALPVEMEREGAPTNETAPSEVTERAASVATPAPSPAHAAEARAHPAAAAPQETAASPEDSASEATEPSTGDGWGDGDGANGKGLAARGGRGGDARGGHDHHAPGGRGVGPGGHRSARGKASLEAGRDWSDCPFPKDAKRRAAFVRISVTVDARGEALDVKVLSDPGEGFGDSAKVCAKRRHYVAGTNDDGEKDATETEPFLVYFTR
jgi:protein TonB